MSPVKNNIYVISLMYTGIALQIISEDCECRPEDSVFDIGGGWRGSFLWLGAPHAGISIFGFVQTSHHSSLSHPPPQLPSPTIYHHLRAFSLQQLSILYLLNIITPTRPPLTGFTKAHYPSYPPFEFFQHGRPNAD